jgi:signal transduction histidine kinase
MMCSAFIANFAFFSRVVAAVCLFLCLSSPSRADNRTVTVGVYENEPKVFTSEDGRPSGIFIDVIEYIAKSEGWKLKYVKGTWAEGLDHLAKGEIDLMPDVAYTSDRENIYSFHKIPVLSVWSQVYAPKGSNIKSILDLNGKRIAVLERTIQLETFSRLTNNFGLKITLIPVSDYKTEFEMLAKGKVDAGVTNRFYGLIHARKFGLEDTPVMFDPAPFFFAAPKKASRQLLDIIDSHLSYLQKDPNSAYYATMKRWTSEEVRFKFPMWLQIFALGAGIVLLMSLGGSVILKRQVNARTHELQRTNQVMERRIIERTAELAEAMEKAQAADRLKSAFLATMSHELRTPLNSIIGFSGILLQGMVGPLNEEQTKQLGMVRASASHLLSLINDVLDISKIEAGEIQVSHEPFDLPASIRKIEQAVQPLAERKGLDLTVEVASDVGIITSDARRVEQVLLNLLSNAIKFTEQGRVTVTCSTGPGTVITRVTDTGVGIRNEDMDKLFKPFLQIDSGLTRKYEGTGLGLSICKKLVQLLGGDIRVESVWKEGSTFTFSIPVQRSAS